MGITPDALNTLLSLNPDEVVTGSFVSDIRLRSGKTLALITLNNNRDHRRPNTLGPQTLSELETTLENLRMRAQAKEIDAVAVTGVNYTFAAGADLSNVQDFPDRETALTLAQLGHRCFDRFSELTVPSFSFINGTALGGGLELALHTTYRTVDSSTVAIGLPEVFLGLIPGWGGCFLLPKLIGMENALTVILENPLKHNRLLNAKKAHEIGLVDEIFSPVNFVENSLHWADQVLNGTVNVSRNNQPGKLTSLATHKAIVSVAKKKVQASIGLVPKAPFRALELLSQSVSTKKSKAFEAEDQALADLITGEQFRSSMYAFNLVNSRAKKFARSDILNQSKAVNKIGVVGAGYMASQFALLFLTKLRVPVIMTDLDPERLAQAVSGIHAECDAMKNSGKLSNDDAQRIRSLLSSSDDFADFASCDFVIEAVFEEMDVKKKVFAVLEKHVRDDTILATNTSSLSVTKMSEHLTHTERVIGFHFFTPVAIMPLIEVVKTEKSNDATVATALSIAKNLRKSAIITADTPGFVVNRILAVLLGEAMKAVDAGTPFPVVDDAFAPLGLPMPPSQLLDLVGLTVGAHVLNTHHAAFPDRFYRSDALELLAAKGHLLDKDDSGKVVGFNDDALRLLSGGTDPLPADKIMLSLENALALELKIMLDDGVVNAVEDIDTCMILGAAWPFHMGGISPYLDRVGASMRVNKRTFHKQVGNA